jgi:hypothetical protein
MKNKVYEIHLKDNGCYVCDCATGVVAEVEEDIKNNPLGYLSDEKDISNFECRLLNTKVGDEIQIGNYTIKAIEMSEAELKVLPEFTGW